MRTPEKREFPDWEERYASEDVTGMPWFYEDLDPDVEKALGRYGLEEEGLRVLDLGTGPGTQALALARRRLRVTATDVSRTAVEKAAALAAKAGLEIEFLRDDILDSRLEDRFRLVHDRGVFHVFGHEARPEYMRQVSRLVSPGGWLFLKCFSEKETREEGPYRFSPDQIRAYFDPAFEIVSIEETVYYGTLDPQPQALFCVLRRR